MIDFKAYWLLLVGRIDYWQGAIVSCGRSGMALSVTVAQSHDKDRGGRSVAGARMSVTEIQNKKCNCGHGKKGGHRSIMGAWLTV